MSDDEIVNVYSAANLFDAEFLCNLLENAGIDARVIGVGSVMVGMIPHEEAAPCLWVRRRDFDQARQIVTEWERVHAQPRPDEKHVQPTWECSSCGETVDENFDLCWNCQTPRQNG